MGDFEDLAGGGLEQGFGKELGQLGIVVFGDQAVGQGKQHVAGQDGVGGAEADMGRFAAPAQFRAV